MGQDVTGVLWDTPDGVQVDLQFGGEASIGIAGTRVPVSVSCGVIAGSE